MSLLTEKNTANLLANPTQLHQSFFSNDQLSFVNFVDLDEWEALQVLEWRNHPKIRQVMFTQQLISKKEHLRFIAQLPEQEKRFYWVVKEKGEALGVIDIVDFKGTECEWGFYLNPAHFGRGLAVNLIFRALDFFFETLQLEKLYGYCHYKNTKGLLFHDLFNIQHIQYEKCHLGNREEWHSRREITRKNWQHNQSNIESIKAILASRSGGISLEHQKLKFDQLFLETYQEAPHLFYQTHPQPRRLKEQASLFLLLLKKIETVFGKKISGAQATNIQYYMDAMQFASMR